MRERNSLGIGGRIFNVLTTISTEDPSLSVHSALNAGEQHFY